MHFIKFPLKFDKMHRNVVKYKGLACAITVSPISEKNTRRELHCEEMVKKRTRPNAKR